MSTVTEYNLCVSLYKFNRMLLFFRELARDICEDSGCNLLTKTQMDQYIMTRRLSNAPNMKKLAKLWKEIQVCFLTVFITSMYILFLTETAGDSRDS